MSKVFDVVHANGKYKGQDGTEKTRWQNVGVVFKSEKGAYTLKLDAVPTRRNEEGELWMNLFVPQAKGEQKAPVQQGFRNETKPDLNDGFGDDIPDF
jgi:hypothetical protein